MLCRRTALRTRDAVLLSFALLACAGCTDRGIPLKRNIPANTTAGPPAASCPEEPAAESVLPGLEHSQGPRQSREPQEPDSWSQIPDDPAETLDQARRAGWTFASIVLDNLAKSNNRPFPGIEEFLKNTRTLRDCVNLEEPTALWLAFDVDALVEHNPYFWQATYEVAPGDPGMTIIHVGFLLSAGEAQRAAILLALTRQCPDPGEQIRGVFAGMHGQASAVIKQGGQSVARGVELFDQGDRDAAMKQYEEAVAVWPQNAWAHYEIGFAFLAREMEADGEKIELGTVSVNRNPRWSEKPAPHFAEARRHDPFRWRAYQGTDQRVIAAFLTLTERVLPAWEKILQGRVSDDVLAEFASGCQAAGLDELALVARQVLVARRGRFDPSDHPFIAKSLRRLAPGEVTEVTLERLASERLPFRQLIKPEEEDSQ